MNDAVAVDVWVRGTHRATTHRITSVPALAEKWTDDDVRQLLSEMLWALDREKHPDGERPEVSLRGFSWIVSPDENGAVLLHVDMQLGTASAGPFAIEERRLTDMVSRVMEKPHTIERVH